MIEEIKNSNIKSSRHTNIGEFTELSSNLSSDEMLLFLFVETS
jgi:hypothetical protein